MIKLYSTHCANCMILEKLLDKKKIDYELIDDKELIISMGFMTVPILELEDGNRLTFPKALQWVNNQ